MTSPTTPLSGEPDPAALLALGLSTQAPDAHAATNSAPPPTPEELAAEFPGLEIIELLGRGGMGAVYKARQRDLDRFVALKILRPGLDADPGFAERFTREARALAQLNHSGIVTLYEFGRTAASRYFILMEFVDGVNLRQLLAAGRLAPREALAIVPPLCDALQYAHDRGLIHRDIKPENILVDRLGRVKIADFGIAKLTTTTPSAEAIGHSSLVIGHSAEGGLMGTPAYMAPEQRDRPAEVDHRADLYALGVVFYQMLTGELPAAGQLQPPSTRVHLDVRLDEIVLRALEKDPARRYAAASDFKTQVETFATTHAPASPPVTPLAAAPAQGNYGFSYRSHRTLFGLPLLHIAVGADPSTGKRRIARGIIAIGEVSQGFIAFGGIAMGGFTFGGISIGAFSYGGLVLALFAYGGLGIGALAAFAGLALAPVALGGLALGWYAFGGSAWGVHASSPAHHDPAAIEFFSPWAREFTQIAGFASFPIMALGFAVMFSAIEIARRHASSHKAAPTAPATDDPPSPPLPLLPASILVFFLFCLCGSLQFAAKNFPAQVAVHFTMAGQPDGWAERGVALLVLLLIGVGVSFFIPCLFALPRFLPALFIDLPHQDFWLSPQRAPATHARLLREGFWVAAFITAFFWGLQILWHWAHLKSPPHFPMAGLWLLAGFVLAALTLRVVRLFRVFKHPERAAHLPPPSKVAGALRPLAPWLLILLTFMGIILPVSTALDILHTHKATAANPARNQDLPAPKPPSFRFGPVREITLPRTRPTAYDFDHGRFVDYKSTRKHPHGIQASSDWHAEHGTDIFADPDSYRPGVLFLGTELAEVAPEIWDAPADEAARHAGKPSQGLMTFIPAPASNQAPATRVYRTPQKTLVLVQLLGATDAADVILRYKTIHSSDASDSAEDQRSIHFDRAGDTMQNIVLRLRSDHGLRLSFENLDFTIADAKTASQIIAEADRNAPYSKLEEALLKLARESKDPNTLLDLGTRYQGTINGASVPDFLTRLTADTPYLARKIGATWLIQPRADSRLAFPVTLKTAGMTVSEAIDAITKQSPGNRPIATGMVFAMPVAPGVDPTPWLSVQAPELDFKATPAIEALCKLTESARPGSVWELAGYQESRMLSVAPSPADDILPVINTAQAWLTGIDREGYSAAWRDASPLLRSEITTEKFSAAMLGTRAPLGKAHVRRLRSATPLTQLPGGRYLLMQFDTKFDSAPAAVETVTFVHESNGIWRAAGYFINPALALSAPPALQTTTQTPGPSVTDSGPAARVNVIGAVNRPGSYPLPAESTLLDALAAAGGWTATANLKKVSILPRSSDGSPVQPRNHDALAILKGEASNPLLPSQASISIPERFLD